MVCGQGQEVIFVSALGPPWVSQHIFWSLHLHKPEESQMFWSQYGHSYSSDASNVPENRIRKYLGPTSFTYPLIPQDLHLGVKIMRAVHT